MLRLPVSAVPIRLNLIIGHGVPEVLCSVRCCTYIADAAIEDFNVCALHDHDSVRSLLEKLYAPCAFSGADDRPIVLPVGVLTEADLVPEPALPGAIHVWEDPRMTEVPEGPSLITHKAFDLTR